MLFKSCGKFLYFIYFSSTSINSFSDELLFMFVKYREMTLDYLASEINSIDPKMDFAKLKSCSLEEIRQELISLKNKKYIDYYDAKYALTYLGNAVLRFFVGEE